MVIDPTFWKDRRVLITGHTGFKGAWLSLWLKKLGANLTGYALKPTTRPSIFEDIKVSSVFNKSVYGDIRDADLFTNTIQNASPEIVIHLAAQSLVRESYRDPVGTYTTNVMGTVNLFEAIRKSQSIKAVLNITTDKCYENQDLDRGYRESDPMGGFDPYSSSKGCAELISSAYRRSYFKEAGIGLATARAGNVIGGGDWAVDRIVPDAIRAFTNNKVLMVRNARATRPWQHVLEPLSGYLTICQQLIRVPDSTFAGSWNFGPNEESVESVSTLANLLVKNWGLNSSWKLDDGTHPHEAQILRLDCTKAKDQINYNPIWGIDRILKETVNWYKAWYDKINMYQFTLKQITSYQQELLRN